MIDVTHIFFNARGPSRVTSRVAVNDRKMAEERTMISRPEPKSNPVAIVDPLEAPSEKPAMTK
jgi:hypothetical protein